jgi:PGF-CTERM protein
MEVSMKSITKLMIVAVIAIALLAAPSAAVRQDANNLTSGDVIFVYERGLDLTDLNTDITALAYYSDLLSGSPDNVITVGADRASFNILAGDVGEFYNKLYYALDGAGNRTSSYVNIKKADVKLDVRINGTSDSVNGKTVTATTELAFKITNNIGTAFNGTVKPTAQQCYIEITTPGGGKIQAVGDANFQVINLTASEIILSDRAFSMDGFEAGTYSAIVKFGSASDFYNKDVGANTVTFDVTTKAIAIESNKDTVIRNNPFVVTITGESKKTYYVYIKGSATDNEAIMPYITDAQSGVTKWTTIPATLTDASPVGANVSTTASGTRTVEFTTASDTDDKTYTIKVLDPVNPTKSDTVKVKVEKGAVTMVASGDQSYFLGEEVTLSGVNTDTNEVFLFIKGPNLPANGGYMCDPRTAITKASPCDGDGRPVDVESDDTWEFKWSTARLNLDAGSYTIYALTENLTYDDLADAEYDTVSVVIKKPFVTATTSASVVAKGDKIYIRGTAEGDPATVAVWILGKNFANAQTETVEDDGTFEYDWKTDSGTAAGQYFVVVQHEMYNEQYDVFPSNSTGLAGQQWDPAGGDYVYNRIADVVEFILRGSGSLQGPDAANALVKALDNPNIDDTYTKLSFLVEEAWINIDPIGDKYVGDVFTITGTTNVAEGNEFLIDVTSASFQPTEKTQTGEFSGASGSVEVTKGETYNEWAFDVDTATFKPDEYIVNVQWVESDVTATTTFNVLAGVAPTPEPTVGPTPEPTEPPVETTAPPPEPTPTPGFGALIALAGLGAVAVLVLRKH